MICKYCELIHSRDESYPLREATKDLKSDFPRCDWHWRYVCDVCGQPCHFNGVTWCETVRKFVCIKCDKRDAREHRLLKRKFWDWNTYYAIKCPYCNEWHATLDRLEYQGEHPWQSHPEMSRTKTGLSAETENKDAVVRNFFSEDSVISDEMIGEAWDKVDDRWFSRYGEFGDVNRQHIIDPTIFKILGQVKGKRILDAGCGNGYLCRLLSKKGAEIVGVDVSKRSIEIAEEIEKKEPMNMPYQIGSICDLRMFEDDTFDLIVSNIVLDDLQDIDKAIRELHRVLKPDGKLVFSILHPCFSSPHVHGWVRKPIDSQRKEDRLYWMVDRYFDRSIEEWTYFDFPPVYSFHRPLSDYMKTLIKSGFTITDFEEPVPTEKAIEEHYREFGNEHDRVPWFLIIGATKQRRKEQSAE